MHDQYTNYVISSAAYCESLFACSADFFSANVLIENIIAEDRPPTADDLEEIATKFRSSSSNAEVCHNRLASFKEVHDSYPGSASRSFKEQDNRLSALSQRTARAATLIGSLKPGKDLQDSIWAEPQITVEFIAAAELVTNLISWQCSFASDAHSQSNEQSPNVFLDSQEPFPPS